jgi:integrase
MRAIIGARLLASKAAQPREKPFDIPDERLTGFLLRVQPSGVRSYNVRTGRNRRVSLGKVGQYTPDEARERCEKALGNLAHGRHPLHGLDGDEGPTLGQFITDTYAPWAQAHRPRTAKMTLDRVKLHFAKWYGQPLSGITLADVEDWRTKRINEGTEPSTVRRDLDTLASVLTRAVKLGHLAENVVRKVERPRIDRTPKVRYLEKGEEVRLREALAARDEEMRQARTSANAWRRARKKDLLPPLPHYGDHLTPAVLLSMNTGMRRGELLSLRWTAIDFKGKQLTIEGLAAKNQQTRYLPLNSEALATLKAWREQAPDNDRAFPFDKSSGFKSAWAPLLTRAKITSFRWHDLRHHFGSRLVQAGVPLNTVRELLGHGSLAMTLRYAHLAPDQKREAVALLAPPSARDNIVPMRRKEAS